jgi:hypothetical protein
LIADALFALLTDTDPPALVRIPVLIAPFEFTCTEARLPPPVRAPMVTAPLLLATVKLPADVMVLAPPLIAPVLVCTVTLPVPGKFVIAPFKVTPEISVELPTLIVPELVIAPTDTVCATPVVLVPILIVPLPPFTVPLTSTWVAAVTVIDPGLVRFPSDKTLAVFEVAKMPPVPAEIAELLPVIVPPLVKFTAPAPPVVEIAPLRSIVPVVPVEAVMFPA